jgi:hypothetical protein
MAHIALRSMPVPARIGAALGEGQTVEGRSLFVTF